MSVIAFLSSLYCILTCDSRAHSCLSLIQVREDAADEVASHAGVGIGLVTALRSTPMRFLNHKEMPIPADLWKPPSSVFYPQQDTFSMQDVERHLQEEASKPKDEEQAASAKSFGLVKTAEEEAEFLEAVQYLAMTASTHLAKARKNQGDVPKHARAALLPVIPALHFLSILEKANHNLFHPQVMHSSDDPKNQFRLLMLLGRTWLTGIF